MAETRVCPHCGSDDIRGIVYGMPLPGEPRAAAKIAYGGCCPEPDSRTHMCGTCGWSFFEDGSEPVAPDVYAPPRFIIALGDITTLEVDAIVNAANEQLVAGAGVCGAIFRAAGDELVQACRDVAPCPTGEARVTPGFKSKARWILHAVGPVWRGGTHGEDDLLASAYRNSLRCAADVGATSIAFPSIATGIYGFPPGRAAHIAARTVREWCDGSPEPRRIVFCCFSRDDVTRYESALAARGVEYHREILVAD